MRALLSKDLAILRRSRLLLALLVLYPVLVALLIGFAISRSPGKPRVAIVDQAPAGETITLGEERIGLGEYTKQLFQDMQMVNVPTRAAAKAKVASGDVLAAIVIPPNIVSKISSGVSQAKIEVIYNGDALEQSFVHSTINSTLAQANLALANQIKAVAARDLKLLLAGGRLEVLGASQEIIGLRHLPGMLRSIAARQASAHDRATLVRIAGFASLASRNLGLATNVLDTVSQPIQLQSTLLHGKRTPLDSYAVVVAVSVSLMFIAVLLAAGALALEREENTLARLLRGLISPLRLLVEKALLAAGCAFAVGLVMLLGVRAFVSIDLARGGLWVLALALGALGFAVLGVAIGALAREVRAATLLAFLLSLPLALLALVPSGSIASGLYDVVSVISFVFPYKAALQALDAAVNGSSPAIGVALAHLAGVTVLFAAIARLGLRRAE